jgi:hypothetical protein
MDEIINIEKILKSSAKKRAELLIYNYNILAAKKTENSAKIKPILNEKEIEKILKSFQTEREIKIYNDYRQQNISFIKLFNQFKIEIIIFERNWYKYFSMILANFYDLKQSEMIFWESFENILLFSYALKSYAEKIKYNDKIILKLIDDICIEPDNFKSNYLIDFKEVSFDFEKNILQKMQSIKIDEGKLKKLIEIDFKSIIS